MLKPVGLLSIVAYILIATLSLAASKTFTGTITDTMCGKKHMIAGKSDAECTRECMKSKGNWTYGLIVGEKVYSLSGDTKQFDSLAGKQVRVTGELNENTIAVQSLSTVR